MRVILVAKKAPSRALSIVESTLKDFGVEYELTQDLGRVEVESKDIAVIVGGDRDVLEALHSIGRRMIPILGVSETDGEGFLTETGVSSFREICGNLVKGNYWLEEATRLRVMADGRELPPALNEVAVFSSKSATLMEYTLLVDGEVVWRDYGDGVIVATPTGSTAYAMSAGGPMVLHQVPVFTVVSVNSMDVTRRPVVVSDSSRIGIDEVSSSAGCVAIVDGIYRERVKDSVEAFKEKEPARLLRLVKDSKVIDRMTRKVKLAEELLGMPPSAKLVLKTLQYEGPLTQKEVSQKTLLPDRTTRLALNLLLQKGLIRRQSLLRDTRRKIYHAVQG